MSSLCCPLATERPCATASYPARSIIYNPEAHLYLVVVVSPLTAIMKDQVSKAVIV